jgi:hypothetical protein
VAAAVSPLTRSASATAEAGSRPANSFPKPQWVNHSRALRFRIVSPTTENRKVPGSDHAGVHRADGDLVDPGALEGRERVGPVGVGERRRVSGAGQHQVPAARPVEVPHQPPRQRVVVGHDAEQVAHLALEPADRERQPGQAGDPRP